MLFGLNFRQWFLMILFGAVHLLHGSIYTLQAPFYPSEAQHKGATASQYGTVFGIYEFVIFVACPLVGSIAMPKFGAKFMLYFGIVLQGTTTVIFGFLDKVNNLTLFLSFSLGLRILEAIGFASSFVSLYSFVPSQFPNHIPLVYGVLEMSNGIGLSMGPGIGGLLYNLGGFLLPFLTIGIVILACLLVVVPALSSTTITVDPGEADRGVISLLKIPAVSINFFAILLQTTLLSFLYANFAEYLRIQFGLSPPTIGTIFCAFGLFHALLSPLWGYLLGKLPSPHYIILAGAILDFIGLVLVGPIPYLGIEPLGTRPYLVHFLDIIFSFIHCNVRSLNLTCTGVFIFAIAHGSLMIAAFINAAIEAKAHDFPDDANTAGLVSGCFMGAYSLGGAVGPPVSGALYDAFGFRIAELFVAGSALFLVIVLSAYAIVSKCGSRGKIDVNNQSEESALLANTNNHK